MKTFQCHNCNNQIPMEDDRVTVKINDRIVSRMCIHCAVGESTPGVTQDNYFALYDPKELISDEDREAHWNALQEREESS